MSTHRAKLADGEVWSLPAGASFQILETDKPVDVEFVYNGQRRSSAKEVERTYYYRPYIDLLDDSGQAFHTVRITAAYGACSIVVDISDANAGTNSLTGVVEVVNSDRVRTDKGVGFLSSRRQSAAAGEYAMIFLHNPVGSGKIIYVNKVILTATDQIDAILGVSGDVSETTADASVTGVSVHLDSGEVSLNKKIGGPRSVAEEILVTATSTVFPNYRGVARVFVDAFGNYTYEFTEPMKVEGGCGLSVQSLTAGKGISGTWEYFEEAA